MSHEALQALEKGNQVMPNLFYADGLYYSYNTIVAFMHKGKRYVLKNYWKTTTGKHLNYIDGGNKKDRLDADEFLKLYKKLIKGEE